MDYTQFEEVLLWLTGIGAPMVVAYILSWVVENWKQWSTFPKEVKFLIPMVTSVLLSVGAKYLLDFPDIVGEISPYFTMIMSAILTYISSQKAYMTAMEKQYGARFRSPTSKEPLEMK